MSSPRVVHVPVVIFGGGIAGLWTLDVLRRRGVGAVLLEPRALGQGQSLWSQGIIHGGVKYTLAGMLNPAAEAIREMPGVWRACLAGQREPDLSRALLRAGHCHLWHTQSLSSRLGMMGAKIGLRVAPVVLEKHERPEALRDCPGTVARLDEQVIDVASVLGALAERNAGRVLHTIGAEVVFAGGGDGVEVAITPRAGDARGPLCVRAQRVVLTAGAGNAALRAALGLDALVCQVRPLHQVMVRGDLPELNGHCTDGAATRATITSAMDREGRRVWQVGGQIAEKGVAMDSPDLVRFAMSELRACLPGVRLEGAAWATYRADRAEMKSASGARPDDATILEEGCVITAWPTKLALAPRLAERVLERVRGLGEGGAEAGGVLGGGWAAPPVAVAPWDEERAWVRGDAA